jgi:hypothetical protein
MLKKFFFDDVRKKPSSEWVMARDVPEAIKILSQESFDVLSLDHDIGFEMVCKECIREKSTDQVIYIPTPEDCCRSCSHQQNGSDLANWMIKNLTEWPRFIIIHSANPYGAQNMYNILKEKTYVQVIAYSLCRYDSIREEDI